MKVKGKLIIGIFLFVVCIIIHIYSNSEIRVETGYSSNFFVSFSKFLRYSFGSLQISIGDILYGFVAGWLIWKLVKGVIFLFRKNKEKIFWINKLSNFVILFCIIYIVFNIFWGINYNRKGIAWQLALSIKPYTTLELKEINSLLVDKINTSKKVLLQKQVGYPSNKQLFAMVGDAYKKISVQYPFLQYQPAALKSSMWGWIGNYTGFTGYYNPFTGEAQVNTTVPKFSQPFTACHEVAHQLGYAKEMEANFVGYLAAASSSDTLFHYSVYLDLFSYANRNLYFIDSSAAKLYSKQLTPEVITDIKEWIAFSRKHQNPVEPLIRWLYGKYLQGNMQPQGIYSYDEVTGFIIAYYKKFGKI
ncbi:MAG: DUF3810 domain-containing protein [Ferruginibacter sp.]